MDQVVEHFEKNGTKYRLRPEPGDDDGGWVLEWWNPDSDPHRLKPRGAWQSLAHGPYGYAKACAT